MPSSVDLRIHLRNTLRFAPVKPAISAGLRAALMTVVPLAIGQQLGLKNALWTTLAGFSVALVDKGGAYGRRAGKMAAVSAVTVLAGVAGTLVGNWTAGAVLTVGLWATLCALARVWGPDAVSIGTTGVVVFVIAVELPAPLAVALVRAGYLAVGAGAAMGLSLLLWPVRLYRPGRHAVAALFRQLALYATTPSAVDVTVDSPSTEAGRVRSALEEARGTLAAIRRGRRAEGSRGQRLLVLLESADQLFGRLSALRNWAAEPAANRAVTALLEDVAERCRALAESLENDRSGVVGPLRERPPFVLPQGFAEAPALHALREEVDAFLSAPEDVIRAAHPVRPEVPTAPLPTTPRGGLLAGLVPDSLVLRHALRVGVTVAAGVWVAKAFELPHGYWVTVTIVVVLQPYVGASWIKGLQRIGGTVVGALLAVWLASWLHGGAAMLVLLFVLAVLSVALMPIHYGLYAIFLTPTFVLLTEVMENDWSLAWVRVLNTVIGGGLALAGTFLLWPSPERQRVKRQLSVALDALAAVLEAAAGPDVVRLEEARRRFGVEILNAEESVQRVMTESPGTTVGLEAMMVVVTYARRVWGTALAARSLSVTGDPAAAKWLSSAGTTVRELAAAVRERRAPSALATREPGPREARLLARGHAQMAILHDAVGRMVESPSPVVSAAA